MNCIKQFFLLLDITSNKNKGKQKEKKNDLVFLIFYHSYVFPEKKQMVTKKRKKRKLKVSISHKFMAASRALLLDGKNGSNIIGSFNYVLKKKHFCNA